MTLAGIVILAGGNSKRMGTAKALLRLPTGETLLDYHVRQAIALSVPIMIADNERGFKVDKSLADKANTTIFHIADYHAPDKKDIQNRDNTGGALVAIESALQALTLLNKSKVSTAISSEYLLVISCDSLIKASELWQRLSTSTNQNDHDKSVICLSDNNHLYPLLALYKVAIEPELRAYIDSGQRRVMRFIEPICQKVAFAPQWQHLTNFNTPADFKKAYVALSKATSL